MNRRLKLKSVLATGTVCLALALAFVAADPLAHDYELSVYDGYPSAFWILLLSALFFGQVVVFESIEGHREYWKSGLGLLLAANAVLLFLPVVRYHMYTKGDMLTFIGMINQIGELGVIPSSNYYPNLHILTLTVSYATGLDVQLLVNLVPPLASLFYVFSLCALLNVIFDDYRKSLFVLPIAALLLFTFENLLFSPSVFGFMLLPLVLFVAFQTNERRSHSRFRLLLIVLVVAVVFYHPLTTLFYIGVFLLLKAAFGVTDRVSETRRVQITSGIVTASIAFVLFFSWYYSFESIIGSTVAVLYFIFGAAQGGTAYAQITSTASRATPQLIDIVQVGIFSYGLAAPIVGLGTVLFGYLAYLFARKRLEFDAVIAFLGATMFSFAACAVVLFFVDFPFGSTRPLRYVRFAGSILVGLGFYALYRRLDARSFRRYLRPSIYVTFFVLAYFSMFMLYGSPMANSENNQVTQAQVEGMEWLLENRDSDVRIDELGISQFRFYTYLNQTNADHPNIERQRYGTAPPPNFAYNNTTMVAGADETPDPTRYVVISELGRTKNPRYFPEYQQFWRHTPDDFQRLETDPTFSHVYDNGEIDAYIVRGIGNETAAPTSRSR